MYRVMVIFEGINEWKKVETGYEASDIDEADRIRNQLLDRNPGMNFVVLAMKKVHMRISSIRNMDGPEKFGAEDMMHI